MEGWGREGARKGRGAGRESVEDRRKRGVVRERWTVGVQNYVLPFRNLGIFVYPTSPVSFGRDTKKPLVRSS